MLPSEALHETQRLLGEATAALDYCRKKRRELVARNLELYRERDRIEHELKQAREALQYQRRKSAKLRRERWEAANSNLEADHD